jgi:phage tail sheath protein FI
MHIAVVDQDGAWTGTAGTVLETFAFVSQASNAKADDGTDNYYANVINNQSAYVRWGAHASALTDAGSTINGAAGAAFVTGSTALSVSLSGGTDDNAATVGELSTAYDLFDDAETIDVNLLIGPETAAADDVTMANYMIAIAEGRKDCVAFVSPAVAETVNNATAATDVKAWADALTSSSYAVIDSTALYVYDKYNDVYRWIVASGAVAGLCANTDNVADAWFSPAGFTRGQILGVTKIAFNPKKAARDDLYKARVNPIVSFPGEGIVLFGDKTAQSKPSAFDRINVRRLFITLEKAVSTAAKFQLFEFNDEFTRAQFRNLVEPFLRDVKGRRGITDFAVICDATNNTGDVIDGNRFVADIYIKPARSINFITLNFIATRTGVEFSEIIGQ